LVENKHLVLIINLQNVIFMWGKLGNVLKTDTIFGKQLYNWKRNGICDDTHFDNDNSFVPIMFIYYLL